MNEHARNAQVTLLSILQGVAVALVLDFHVEEIRLYVFGKESEPSVTTDDVQIALAVATLVLIAVATYVLLIEVLAFDRGFPPYQVLYWFAFAALEWAASVSTDQADDWFLVVALVALLAAVAFFLNLKLAKHDATDRLRRLKFLGIPVGCEDRRIRYKVLCGVSGATFLLLLAFSVVDHLHSLPGLAIFALGVLLALDVIFAGGIRFSRSNEAAFPTALADLLKTGADTLAKATRLEKSNGNLKEVEARDTTPTSSIIDAKNSKAADKKAFNEAMDALNEAYATLTKYLQKHAQ